MDTTGGEHGNLKFCTNGWSTPRFGTNRGHQIDIGGNVTFGLARESLDTPDNGLLFWFVLGSSKRMLDLGLGSILGYRDFNHDMGGKELI